MTNSPRIAILCTGGHFSRHVIKAILAGGINPVAFALPGFPPVGQQVDALFVDSHNPLDAFHQLVNAGTPTLYARGNSDKNLLPELKKLNLDFILVACWPSLLSQPITSCARHASLNLHPSLLPKFRGANPIMDQLQTVDKNFGVTLHLLSQTLDEGDILLQQSVEISPSAGKKKIEKATAQAGAKLFTSAIHCFGTKHWKPFSQTKST